MKVYSTYCDVKLSKITLDILKQTISEIKKAGPIPQTIIVNKKNYKMIERKAKCNNIDLWGLWIFCDPDLKKDYKIVYSRDELSAFLKGRKRRPNLRWET